MKKIYLGLVMSAALLTTSCDMDTTNFGVIDQGNAIESIDDCRAFMNGMMQHLRSKTGGNYMAMPDMQMDQFVGLIDNGNRMGLMSAGTFNASDQDITNMFYNLYILINDANYFVPKADALIANPDITDADKALIKYYKGAALLSSAYGYWYLFDKYVDYKEADLDAPGKGLPIETVYHPSGDRATYVGRSTIRETVTHINNQLKDAVALMREYEENVSYEYCNPGSCYVSSYVAEALQARFALLTQDYATALNKAEDVINSGFYELADIDNYAAMWVNDEGPELMFVPFAEKGTGGLSTGRIWYTNNLENNSDYIPTFDTWNSYEDGDIRFTTFFKMYEMVISNESYYAYAFVKYPGNPILNTQDNANSNLNKGKPFRLSEMYLVAAEAAAADGAQKNEAKANSYLNELRSKRIDGYTEQSFSGTALMNQIREERGKELIGEGFRLSDLRRWDKGFTREAGWENLAGTQLEPLAYIMEVVRNTSNNVTYQPDDYRFVWPIPTREMQVNPQIAGQQNPRY